MGKKYLYNPYLEKKYIENQNIFTELSSQNEFWSNMTSYAKYFVTVMLGTTYAMVSRFSGSFKKPSSAFLFIIGLLVTLCFLVVTMETMLGVVDPIDFNNIKEQFNDIEKLKNY